MDTNAELRAELDDTRAKLDALKAQKGSLVTLQNDFREKAAEADRLRDQVSKERATSRANLQKVMRIGSEKKVLEDQLAQALQAQQLAVPTVASSVLAEIDSLRAQLGAAMTAQMRAEADADALRCAVLSSGGDGGAEAAELRAAMGKLAGDNAALIEQRDDLHEEVTCLKDELAELRSHGSRGGAGGAAAGSNNSANNSDEVLRLREEVDLLRAQLESAMATQPLGGDGGGYGGGGTEGRLISDSDESDGEGGMLSEVAQPQHSAPQAAGAAGGKVDEVDPLGLGIASPPPAQLSSAAADSAPSSAAKKADKEKKARKPKRADSDSLLATSPPPAPLPQPATPPPARLPPPAPAPSAVMVPQYSPAESSYNRMVQEEIAAAQHAARRPGGAPAGGIGPGGAGISARSSPGGNTGGLLGLTLGGLGPIAKIIGAGPAGQSGGAGRLNPTVNGSGVCVHALFNQGRYAESLEVAESQRRLLLDAYGGDHHEYATSVNNVATLYQERRLGHEHPHTLASLANLATVYEAMGQREKAEALNALVRAMRMRWDEKQRAAKGR
ncbi:hypothetical protein T492DRAFT_1063117 [Pavlovales sp. CCMP2436]|nr:hypothetical protein T492DRAFT_1063117 [Pavlovales sp. CCMP2436]